MLGKHEVPGSIPGGGSMITLTTDFSDREHYAGVVKGVIKSFGNIDVVDITNNVDSFDILHGAYILLNIIDYFPNGTVHLMVIDPGVGTDRIGVVAKINNSYFVGPNNGLLTFVKERVGEIYKINMEGNVSKTFHGRDVFAPVAAKISLGIWPENLEKIGLDSIVSLNIQKYVVEKDYMEGTIIHIDRFGNIITNIPGEKVSLKNHENLKIVYGKEYDAEFVRTYGEEKNNGIIALINSENFLEIAVNGSSAQNVFKAKKMERVKFYIPGSITKTDDHY